MLQQFCSLTAVLCSVLAGYALQGGLSPSAMAAVAVSIWPHRDCLCHTYELFNVSRAPQLATALPRTFVLGCAVLLAAELQALGALVRPCHAQSHDAWALSHCHPHQGRPFCTLSRLAQWIDEMACLDP